jgi:hypothetical protein
VRCDTHLAPDVPTSCLCKALSTNRVERSAEGDFFIRRGVSGAFRTKGPCENSPAKQRPVPPEELADDLRLSSRFVPAPELREWALRTFVLADAPLRNPIRTWTCGSRRVVLPLHHPGPIARWEPWCSSLRSTMARKHWDTVGGSKKLVHLGDVPAVASLLVCPQA